MSGGLAVVTRHSLSRIEQANNAAVAYFSDFCNKDNDERNWSFSYLREQLQLKSSRELFRRYQVRVQHALFVELLVFNIVYNSVALLALTFFPAKVEDGNAADTIIGIIQISQWCRAVSLIVHVFIFAASYKESLFRSVHSKMAAAWLILLSMCAAEMGTTVYKFAKGPPEQLIRHSYYIVLTTSVFLPFPRKLYCAISGSAIIAVDLLFEVFSNVAREDKLVIVCADAIFLLTTLCVGLAIRYLIEVMSRRAFLDRRECIESKIKKENEKNQEEKLLQSALPAHIAKEVREDIRMVIKNMDRLPLVHKPFNKLYVEKHKVVSILYADIVNSMLLAASLNVSDLVSTLNDLFGRFDEASEKNNCMRIKLLGDCYYCVSGVPEKDVRHADNCVRAGLAMIDIIRSVREERNINVDMRIGIHSGNILGGLLGLRKWQFDIWSRDVTIASHMEQAGLPGYVHITKTTKDHLQDDCYDIQSGDGHLRDLYLQSESVQTFLIAPQRKNDNTSTNNDSDNIHYQRQISVSSTPKANISLITKRQSSGLDLVPKRRRAALDYSLIQYKKIVKQVNKIMENAIDKMALSKKDQWFSNEGIQPLLLTFHESGQEGPYLAQPDPLFKYYLLCMILIFCGITLIHLLVMSSTLEFWLTYGVALVFILAACLPSWIGYIWLSIKEDVYILDSKVLRVSRKIWQTTALRVAIWLIISSIILFCSVVGLNECLDGSVFKPSLQKNVTVANESSIDINELDLNCDYPWFYTLCAALAMTTTSVFLRIHFLMKLLLNVVSLLAFWYLMDFHKEEVFRQRTAKLADWEIFDLPLDQSHCYYLTFVVIILHILDRQIEYICRLDYLTKVHLKVEQKEAETTETVNRMLLYNILPQHVARFYMDRQMETDGQRIEESYHEECSSVAVMFASIPNFANFYYEDDHNEEGLRCIQLLNEIICDFDLLLSENEFSTVEKIKTIGSTYMAACGLHSKEKSSVANRENAEENVLTLIEFAVSMMARLQELNKDAMQEFQLRIGISIGPVMAGVVGTVKPQYDIWGDTVNVASRMDSTGVSGRIQVVQEVADLLKSIRCPYKCECRGEILVKGKGMLVTYLMKTPYDEPHIQTTQL